VTAADGHTFRARAKYPIARAKSEIYHWLAPEVVKVGAWLAGSTAAILEYPFEPSGRWGWGHPVHEPTARLLARGRDHYADVVGDLRSNFPRMASIRRRPQLGVPCWENEYWTGLDAIRQYTAIATRRPTTYLEVGSGHSTLFARRAITDHDLATRIMSIDPCPRADVDAVCDVMYRTPFEQVDQSIFDELAAGDVVLIDGSHIVFMGADTVVAVLEMLPRLPPGVLVGIHDIFLPWDYPPEWDRRWYGEQYVLAAFLMGEPAGWRIDFPAWYVCHETTLVDDLDDMWSMVGDPPGRTSSAMWIESIAA
jgi:hypothetical protein